MNRRYDLRVLQVIPAMEAGGAERVVIDIAQAIARAGGRALVASRGGRMERELVETGGEVARLPVHSKSPAVIVGNAGRLSALVRRENMSVIHAHSRAPAWSSLWASRLTGRPLVTTYHGVYVARGPLKRWYNSVMTRSDAVIATSEYTRQHILAEHRLRHPERVIAIPPGVDVAAFDRAKVSHERVVAMRKSWGVGPDENRAIFVVPARLSRIKGQDTVVQAAAMVEAVRPGAALYIFAGDAQGRETYLAELDGAAIAAGVKHIIRRVGHVRDMPAALAAASVGVFPSLVPESFGKAAVEAQAIGLPVIAADLGGQAETVRAEETGILFPAGAPEELAAAIIRMLDMDPERRGAMAAAGMERARTLYSAATMQREMLEVYGRLMQDRRL
jgi:glycosyltransferase involved in cell wall biosynthesis